MKQEKLMQVLLQPRITEKATRIGDQHRQFVFRVAGSAGKESVRKAVELMFSVEVQSVRVCNVKGKQKLFKQKPGRRPGWKKAYVTLKPGFDINFVPA
jgi:large subunit ribosomal protein L23